MFICKLNLISMYKYASLSFSQQFYRVVVGLRVSEH